MMIAERLYLPESAVAILWDMDGVLLDTLGFDFAVCNQLLQEKLGTEFELDKDFIRSIFAYHPPDFWKRILTFAEEEYGVSGAMQHLEEILGSYNRRRNDTAFKALPGIREILQEARDGGLALAAVSNNPTEDVRLILSRAGLVDTFSEVIGNDIGDLKKKPAPDTYLFAAERLGVKLENCVVVEDSIVGLTAGRAAGCHVIGVATGGTEVASLEASGLADRAYVNFRINHADLQRGHVTNKVITTPNEFVSHMIEHIAWRMGAQIDLCWNNNDWFKLGDRFGREVKRLGLEQRCGVALGMIDDGSAEVAIKIVDEARDANAEIRGIPALDLEWFLGCRCEQVSSGEPLVRLIEGLAQGLEARISVMVWSMEDPHHAWEGVFRSLGIALGRMAPNSVPPVEPDAVEILERSVEGAIRVEEKSLQTARVIRTTAESEVSVEVDFEAERPSAFEIRVPSVIRVGKLGDLLHRLAEEAGFSLRVRFDATVLGSSHVVAEDVGLVLGRALKEILVLRMEHRGTHGAGSSVDSLDDLAHQPIRVGLSVEGRKCWKLVPFDGTFDELRKNFIVGHDVCGELYSEDLDDFLDGLSGGLACSIMVHVKEVVDPAEGWPLLFANLGKALREVFEINPYRKGVPPGVKATLA